jgi:hypothetical protein
VQSLSESRSDNFGCMFRLVPTATSIGVVDVGKGLQVAVNTVKEIATHEVSITSWKRKERMHLPPPQSWGWRFLRPIGGLNRCTSVIVLLHSLVRPHEAGEPASPLDLVITLSAHDTFESFDGL